MRTKKPFQLLSFALLLWALGLAVPTLGQGRDTVFAVQKLFGEKRGGAAGYSAAAASAVSPARYAAQRPDGRPTAQETRQDLLAGAAFGAIGLVKGERYSASREAAIIEGYALGNPIPADIRRKLRRKHFHRTAKDLGPAR
jgi:hypothetical protein